MLRQFVQNPAEIIRFATAGLTSAVVYLAVLYPVLPYAALWFATIIAYVAAMVVNYTIQRLWTFKSRRPHRQAVPRYVATHGGAILLNITILEVFFRHMGLPLLPVQLFAFCAIFAWSYVLQKLWVFDSRD